MTWDNDKRPVIQIKSVDGYTETLNSIASAFNKLGLSKSAKEYSDIKHNLDRNIPIAVKKAGDKALEESRRLIADRQYHSKSGYIGNYKLHDSVKAEMSEEKGNPVAKVFPTATNNGYEYGQAFENGLLNKNYPAQHPFRDAGDKLDSSKFANEAWKKSMEVD